MLDGLPISEEFRKLLALPCKLGAMGVIDPTENANDENKNSRELTSQLTNSIKQQEHRYTVSDENIKNCNSSIKKKRKDKHLNILTSLPEQMSSTNITCEQRTRRAENNFARFAVFWRRSVKVLILV